LKKRLVEIAQGTASVFRAEAKVDFGSGCPTMVNDKQLSEDILDYMKELQGPKKAFSVGKLNSISGGKAASGSAGSEDFAYVSQEVPSVMMALAAGQPEKGYLYPQHHPMVKFDEAALAEGAAAYAYGAIRWLEMQSH
jgi:hippurate hydrolase